jgi:hypothetical protein
MAMNTRVSWNTGNFLTRWATVSFFRAPIFLAHWSCLCASFFFSVSHAETDGLTLMAESQRELRGAARQTLESRSNGSWQFKDRDRIPSQSVTPCILSSGRTWCRCVLPALIGIVVKGSTRRHICNCWFVIRRNIYDVILNALCLASVVH